MNRAPVKTESANASLSPARVPEVQAQIDDLFDAIQRPDFAVASLISKTEPVSRERDVGETAIGGPNCLTVVGRSIQSLRIRVSSVAEILESLADRIEV